MAHLDTMFPTVSTTAVLGGAYASNLSPVIRDRRGSIRALILTAPKGRGARL